ncbi:MAG: hypothetical protein Fur0032_16160 [Terrimicrobiaceae bacterium]
MLIWDGGGTTDNWSDGANWDGDVPPDNDGTATASFAGVNRLTPWTDSAWNLAGLEFASGAGSFQLGGLDLTLGAGGVSNSSSVSQTVGNTVILASSQSFSAGSGNLVFTGDVQLGNYTLTINATTSARSVTLSGDLSGPGNLTKVGAGTLYLDGANSHSGVTTLTAGTTVARNNSAFGTGNLRLNGGSLSSNASRTISNSVSLNATSTISGSQSIEFSGGFTLASGGSLNVTNTALTSISGNLTESGGSRAFTKSGNGNLLLSGNLGYSGSTVLTGGTLALSGAATLPASNLFFRGGILAMSGSFSRNLGTGSGQVRWNSGSNGGFAAYGGNLVVSGIGSTPVWGSTTHFLANGRTLLLNSAIATSMVDWTSPFSLGTANRTISVADNTALSTDIARISGEISGSGGLIKSGRGILELTAANTFTGALWIQQGRVVVSSMADDGLPSPLGAGSGSNATIRMGSGTSSAILEYTGTGHSTNRGISLRGSSGGATLWASGSGAWQIGGAVSAGAATAKSLTLRGNSTALNSLSGNISNGSATVSVVKTDSGTWVLAGNNTYTGNTTVTAGTLRAGNNSAFGTGSLVLNGGTLAAEGGSRTIPNTVFLAANSAVGGNTPLTLTGNFSQSSSRTLTISNTELTTFSGSSMMLAAPNTARTLTINNSGPVLISSSVQNGTGTGADALTKTGGGLLTLSGNNSYTGATTISAGTLRAESFATALGAGTLNLGAARLELAGSTPLSFGRNTTLTANATIASDRTSSGSGLTYTLGTLSLGARTLTIEKGTLVTSGTAGVVFGTTSLSASGAVFSPQSGAELVTGNLTGTNRSFTVSGAGNMTINGTLSTGTGTLTKSGTGTLRLGGTNANTRTGNTLITGGTLVLDKPAGVNAVAAGTLTIGDASGLDIVRLDGSDQIANSVAVVLNGGRLDLNGFSEQAGTLDLNASSSLTLGGTSSAAFAASALQNWSGFTLTINGFTTGTNLLRFGTNASGLSPTQLNLLRFADYGNASGQIDSLGYVSPVPEPSALATLIAMAFSIFLIPRRRRQTTC